METFHIPFSVKPYFHKIVMKKIENEEIDEMKDLSTDQSLKIDIEEIVIKVRGSALVTHESRKFNYDPKKDNKTLKIENSELPRIKWAGQKPSNSK